MWRALRFLVCSCPALLVPYTAGSLSLPWKIYNHCLKAVLHICCTHPSVHIRRKESSRNAPPSCFSSSPLKPRAVCHEWVSGMAQRSHLQNRYQPWISHPRSYFVLPESSTPITSSRCRNQTPLVLQASLILMSFCPLLGSARSLTCLSSLPLRWYLRCWDHHLRSRLTGCSSTVIACHSWSVHHVEWHRHAVDVLQCLDRLCSGLRTAELFHAFLNDLTYGYQGLSPTSGFWVVWVRSF